MCVICRFNEREVCVRRHTVRQREGRWALTLAPLTHVLLEVLDAWQMATEGVCEGGMRTKQVQQQRFGIMRDLFAYLEVRKCSPECLGKMTVWAIAKLDEHQLPRFLMRRERKGG